MKHDTYTLEVHHFPEIVAKGLIPVAKPRGYSSDESDYRPHTFTFANPPSREDFLEACLELPWTHVWQDSLLSLVRSNPWPWLSIGKKAADVDLKDDAGTVVGRLKVSRDLMFSNATYERYHLGTDEVLKGFRGDKDAARELLWRNECEILDACHAEKAEWYEVPKIARKWLKARLDTLKKGGTIPSEAGAV